MPYAYLVRNGSPAWEGDPSFVLCCTVWRAKTFGETVALRFRGTVGLWVAALAATPALTCTAHAADLTMGAPTTIVASRAWATNPTSTAPTAKSSTTPASTGSSTSSPSGASSTTAASGSGYVPLTPAQLAEQVARAGELRTTLLAAGKDIEAAMTALDKSTAKVNKALETYSWALGVERDAEAESTKQRALARSLQVQLDEGRRSLRGWAVDVYTRGGDWAEALAYLEALTKTPEANSNPLSAVSYLTDNKIRTVEDLRRVTVAQKVASMDADAAELKAKKFAAKAKTARNAAKKAVDSQKQLVIDLKMAHQAHIAEAGPLAGLLLGSGDGTSVSAAQGLVDALMAADVSIGDLKLTPCTDNTGTYPNGQFPPSALCPLVGSPGNYLVPKAAAAFNAMSKTYAEQTGSLLCVTDSYRSYAEQVIIKGVRGGWAATPGTSEHGLGQALDLCGGVQDYSNPAHLWLVQNAPLFGWFHPAWAAQNGALPEPWHWEYAG